MNREYVQPHVVEAAMANWELILDEVSEIAAEYERAAWETLVLQPGDVQLVSSEDLQPGLDVLVPDDEYVALEGCIESGVSFDSYEVHKGVMEEAVHLIVIMEDSSSQFALLYPAFYGIENTEVIEQAKADGELRTYLRRLNGEYVELIHHDPELFDLPDE
ncbi:DUF7529 family protein (plasmid) [Haloferax prahovense]|uniref:DUF7529 family protein n=1 Tax=Haloferax prahovense TaxID=381852 RepID=UPI003C756A21